MTSQIQRVEKLLKQQGFVSRNSLIDTPYDKVLRLGGIINVLRNRGLVIDTDMTTDKNDCIYKIRPKGVKTLTLETGEIIRKPIWS